MAKSWMGPDNTLNDDMIRETLKTELGELKASDKLFEQTLKMCKSELEKDKKSVPQTINKLVIRYAATLAACLLIVVVALSSPKIMHSKSTSPSEASQKSALENSDAGKGERSLDKAMTMDIMAAPEAPAPEMSAAPAAPQPEGEVSIQFSEGIASRAYGFNAYTIETKADNKNDTAFTAILSDYNLNNQLSYSYNADDVLKVSMLREGSLDSENLKTIKSYRELLSGKSFWLLLLHDTDDSIPVMLPIFELATSEDTPVSSELELMYAGQDRVWMSSSNAVMAAHPDIMKLTNGEAINTALKENAKNISDYVIVDLNGACDYMVFISSDNKEFAIPFFTSDAAGYLVNGEVYSVKDALLKLSEYMDSQN